MKREFNVFLCSLMFFTRIPVKLSIEYSDDLLSKSTKYLPLLGLGIGALGAGIFWLSNLILPQSISVLLSMVGTIILTGAFHEDGFADACDGFGGGWTKEKILVIMKDSRIGAYGMIGMSLLLLTKFSSLTEISATILPMVMIVGHSISRWAATNFVYTHQYAREDETSKSKPVAKQLDLISFLFASIIAFGSFALLPYKFALAIIAVFMTKFFFARYIKKWIGGYTGDVLGATQQLTEVAFYISVLILNNIEISCPSI